MEAARPPGRAVFVFRIRKSHFVNHHSNYRSKFALDKMIFSEGSSLTDYFYIKE